MKKTLIYAALSLFVAFAVACKKDSTEEQPLYPSSDYQLSTDGKVLEKWLNPETISVDMQKDIKLREVTSIAPEAFKDRKKLTSIVISDKVEHIRYRAFENCTQLTNVHIPNGVTTLGLESFTKCYNLVSITIPSTIQSVGNQAFYDSGLKTVTIKDGVKNIETGAFRECRGLITINFPNTLTHIGDYAFYDCYNLPSVNLPKSIESIGRDAFGNCGSLTTMTVNATTPPVIKSTTFSKFTVRRISVPASSVNAYKIAESWSEFSDKIVALP
ncbi:hypothetical protein CGC58_06255 [Capnocytophaga stomatis]|uniref:Cell surface protein n=1 Tax=Capnocytophaga stomatis TaxID=1848904 RepID=A0A250FW62_9FLAO|nr:leucine-rich repeat domain-containing protein [Capnocytophaga stomatis]ATA89360.1 hypothetical protein CGC58_06255 [Capnocytophaga stomatis]